MERLPTKLWLEIADYLPFYSGHLLRVNRQWFSRLVHQFWKDAEDYRLLLVESDRRQIYASVIRTLTLSCRHAYEHIEFGKLQFPILEMLLLQDSTSPPLPSSCLTGYLVPTLKMVSPGKAVDAEFLNALASRCPQLNWTLLSLNAPSLTQNDIVGFLKKCPSLDEIRLGGSLKIELSHALLRALALTANIKCLDLDRVPIHDEAIHTADLQNTPNPFPSLERLKLDCLSERTTTLLLPSVQATTELCIAVGRFLPNPPETYGSSLFSKLPLHLPNLLSLDIGIYSELTISPTDLVAIGRLPRLKELHIVRNGVDGWITIQNLNDTHIKSLVSGLADLQGLSLHCKEDNLTTACLVIIAKHCPCLRTLALPSLDLDLLQLQLQRSPVTSFPLLTELVINSFSPVLTGTGVSERCAPILQAHFPKMVYLSCYTTKVTPEARRFADAVREAWARGRRAQRKRVRGFRRRMVDWS